MYKTNPLLFLGKVISIIEWKKEQHDPFTKVTKKWLREDVL